MFVFLTKKVVYLFIFISAFLKSNETNNSKTIHLIIIVFSNILAKNKIILRVHTGS